MARSPQVSPLAWFLAGTAVAGVLLWSQAVALGDWSGLLQVGESSNLRPVIEEQLPNLPVVPGPGHDGQISYAVGLDPTGESIPGLLDHAGYRYRRILYPALASGVGTMQGTALLAGMISLAALGMGLAAAGIALLADEMGLPGWVQIAVLANPGLWLAVRLLTPDALAIGLAFTGLAFAKRSRHVLGVVLLAGSALTKDQYILAAVGAAIYLWHQRDRTAAVIYFLVPGAVLASWSAFVSLRMGAGFSPRSNFAAPFRGIAASVPAWSEVAVRDLAYGTAALAVIVVTIVALLAARNRFLHSIGWLWVALPILSSSWVWDFGNNALRAFAFLMPIAALALATALKSRRRHTALAQHP